MYDHKLIEQEVFNYWEKEKIYEKQKEISEKSKNFIYFVDGPPYATGEIHPGTAWNKCIKDAFIRYYRMNGYAINDKPGFDTHGLPIEVKVEQKLGIKNKQEIEKIGIEKFIKECKDFVDKYIQVMTKQFKRLAVWMDLENPYITYKNSYIEKCWKMLKKANEKNLLYNDDYVIPYCYRCQTTLANYELEYYEKTDPSIYVKFPIKEKTYLLAWTTTPWTLIGNMAIAVHEELKYVELEVENENLILLNSKVDEILKKTGKNGIIKKVFDGKELVNLPYSHPFQDLIKKNVERRVVGAKNLVTEETGTGIVHIAPAHGPEDFEIGKLYNIEPFNPVNEQGFYTEEAGFFSGKHVKDANEEIIKILKERNMLYFSEKIRHRYPHCWRCKTPLIYLKTKQWFLKINNIKERMIEEAKKIKWFPKIAETRFLDVLEKSPDWCISRQRYWGVPLPIWKCEKCGKIFVIGSKEELKEDIDDLHRPYIDNVVLKCECNGTAKRLPDVMDVWFDSGNAVWASSDIDKDADLIIEGHDQTRGWFYSLLGCGVIYKNNAPYKNVVMHGFFLDEKGEKMSKSLGNFIPVDEILDRYGCDAFRIFSLSNNVWEDIKFTWKSLEEAKAFLLVYINLVKYADLTINEKIYSELREMSKDELLLHDRWLLSKLNETIKEYHKAFEEKNIAKALRSLKTFIVDDVSKKYMKIAKDYIKEGEKSSVYAFYKTLINISILLSPFSPVITEYCYVNYLKKFEKKESIHLFKMPKEDEKFIDKKINDAADVAFSIIEEGLKIRAKMKVKLRFPLKTVYIKENEKEKIEMITAFSYVIKKLLNVKEVVIGSSKEEVESSENGYIALSKKIDESLYEEGIINEICRKIQHSRKLISLKPEEKIYVTIYCDEEISAIGKKFDEEIKRRVNAVFISYEQKLTEEEAKDFYKYEIGEKPFYVKITTLQE